MTPDFKAILNAAWARVDATEGWATKRRVLRHWADVPAEKRPAVFQAMCTPTAEPLGRGTDAKWTIPLAYYVYVSHSTDDDAVSPQELLAERIAVVIDAFKVPPGLPAQTLGGLVSSCRVEGPVEMDDGWLGTDAVARVPVTIVVG